MPASWTPLLPSEQAEREREIAFEGFADITQSPKSTLFNVLTGIGIMTLGIIVALTLAWSYTKDRTLFTCILGLLGFAFSVHMLVYIVMIRKSISYYAFNYYSSLIVLMCLVNILVFIVFMTMYVRKGHSARDDY